MAPVDDPAECIGGKERGNDRDRGEGTDRKVQVIARAFKHRDRYEKHPHEVARNRVPANSRLGPDRTPGIAPRETAEFELLMGFDLFFGMEKRRAGDCKEYSRQPHRCFWRDKERDRTTDERAEAGRQAFEDLHVANLFASVLDVLNLRKVDHV